MMRYLVRIGVQICIQIGVRIRIRFGAHESKEFKNDVSRKSKAKLIFSGKIYRVQFLIEISADSYPTGNCLCTKLYGNLYADSYAKSYV
jgi:hypothetical protein